MSFFNQSFRTFASRATRTTASMVTIGAAIGSTAFITGCGSSSSHNEVDMRTFQIQVSNLTANQPLSPIAVVLHQSGYQAWTDGEAASSALEMLAEGGDNTSLLADAANHSAYLGSKSGSAAIGPGSSESVQLDIDANGGVNVSVVSMLVNTNDAYTGINATALAGLATGEQLQVKAPVWDAGTESNTEAAGSIPGPADGGEGFNAARSDSNNRVHFHSGVISNQDGLSASVLNAGHRFDNPAAMITITRLD